MRLISALFLAALTACSSAPPTLQTGPEAETTFDGLVRIDNSRFKQAWADPEIDFSQYTKVMPGGATFEFRAVPKTTASRYMTSSQSEFWISDANRERLEKTVSDIFAEEIRKASGWSVAEEAGPNVLTLRGALLDIVSYVPPEQIGRSEIYLSRIGEATLVIEGIDSLSGEVIFRAVERRPVETAGAGASNLRRSNTVTNWAEVSRWARRYATAVREGLESIHQ
ncbi:MAG: DUF3313 family protein [Gammaproteobacteria bacterium]|nr:DUF3313 family protein [Gammaproteobacteria bacterium]